MYRCNGLDNDVLIITIEFKEKSWKFSPRPGLWTAPGSSQASLFQASLFTLLGYGIDQTQPLTHLGVTLR